MCLLAARFSCRSCGSTRLVYELECLEILLNFHDGLRRVQNIPLGAILAVGIIAVFLLQTIFRSR